MSKKGQGLPLETIIVAAIVIIVLVVIIAIFSGRIAIFASDLDKQASTDVIKARFEAKTSCKVTEASLLNALSTAAGSDKSLSDDTERAAYEAAKSNLIKECDTAGTDELTCKGNSNCEWR